MVTAPPVVQTRHISLDVMRGAAILGILLANIASFAGPEASLGIQAQMGELRATGWEAGVLTALVSGKFRGMLAILFGIGLWMQYERRVKREEPWPGTYFKRTALLFAIGVIHGVFIWYGDILATYAVTACLAMLFVRLQDKTLFIVACGLIGLSICFGLLGLLAAVMMPTTTEQPDLMSMKGMEFLKPWLDPVEETRIYQQGTYLEQLIHRIGMGVMLWLMYIVLVANFVGQFLLGMWLARKEVLSRPQEHLPMLKKLALFGFLVGLPLNLLAIPIAAQGKDEAFSGLIELGVGGFLSIGYLALLAWLSIHAAKALKPLAAVGKCALSCYLLTSILATTIFYSYGGALFGRATFPQVVQIVLIIWVVLIAFALLWTRKFAYGPVEWLWRSAVEKRKLDMRPSP